MFLLVLPDCAIGAVIRYDDLRLGAILNGSRQFLAGHQDAAVADEHDRHAVLLRKARGDARRYAEAHGSADGSEQQIGRRHLPVAVHPRRHIAGIRGDNRVIRRRFRNGRDHCAEIDAVFRLLCFELHETFDER